MQFDLSKFVLFIYFLTESRLIMGALGHVERKFSESVTQLDISIRDKYISIGIGSARTSRMYLQEKCVYFKRMYATIRKRETKITLRNEDHMHTANEKQTNRSKKTIQI